MDLITVASSGNVMITNAAVSPSGRLFGNFPRWTNVPTPSVGEATADGGFTPFPGGDWNEWRPGLSPDGRFVCTHGLHADRENNLWAIDDASPHHGPMVEGGAKLVRIDLANNRVSRAYPLGPDLAPPGAVLSHMRVDKQFLYVTDSGFGAIVVIDRETGRGHRTLEGARCSRADTSIVPVIHGQPMRHPDGKVPVIQSDQRPDRHPRRRGRAHPSGYRDHVGRERNALFFRTHRGRRPDARAVNRPYEVFKITLP